MASNGEKRLKLNYTFNIPRYLQVTHKIIRKNKINSNYLLFCFVNPVSSQLLTNGLLVSCKKIVCKGPDKER